MQRPVEPEFYNWLYNPSSINTCNNTHSSPAGCSIGSSLNGVYIYQLYIYHKKEEEKGEQGG